MLFRSQPAQYSHLLEQQAQPAQYSQHSTRPPQAQASVLPSSEPGLNYNPQSHIHPVPHPDQLYQHSLAHQQQQQHLQPSFSQSGPLAAQLASTATHAPDQSGLGPRQGLDAAAVAAAAGLASTATHAPDQSGLGPRQGLDAAAVAAAAGLASKATHAPDQSGRGPRQGLDVAAVAAAAEAEDKVPWWTRVEGNFAQVSMAKK